MHVKKILGVAFFFQIAILPVQAQQDGFPFIRNYSPQEYKTSPQNWAVVQDQRGLMYFGNNDGVLVFDGVNWRLIKQPGVSALTVDSIGRIFIGFENDIGYLQPGDKGIYKYYSLKLKIPEKYRDVGQCYSVFSLNGRIVFQTSDKIIVYHNDLIKVLTVEEEFYWSFEANGIFYVTIKNRGLYYLKNDSLIKAPGGELFIGENVASIIPYQKNELLIVTYRKGIFIYSTDRGTKLYKPEGFEAVDDFISDNDASCGIRLANKDYAIGTIQGGIIVFSPDGEVKNIYNKSTDLQDNSVYWLFSDQNQQIWAVLDNGISLIQNNIPFTKYTEKNGLNGAAMCLSFFKNSFYVGTSQYLYILNRNGDFESVEGTESQNFHLFEAKGLLLLANLSGIFEIKGKKAVPLPAPESISALSLCTLSENPGYLLAGATNGLYLVKFENQSWKVKHRIKGFNKPAYKLGVDKHGNIWASTFLDLFKLKLNTSLDSVISFQQCTIEQRLPTNYATPFTIKHNQVVFGTEQGIYGYDNDKNRFILNPYFRILDGKVVQFIEDKNGDILFEQRRTNSDSEKGVLQYRDGQYYRISTPFYKFKDFSGGDSQFNICSAPDGSIIFGTGAGVLKYNPSIEVNYDRPFNTLIRRVYSNDSLLFGGEELLYPYSGKKDGDEIKFSQNNLIFHYAATYYEDSEKNLYSYRLLGSDLKWSEWTHDTKKEYTLHKGRYIFQVRSKNQYQIIGSTASYSFSILAPWYMTDLAIVFYFIVFILFLWLIIKLYTRRLGRQKENLEKIVAERTEQVLIQQNEILENNERLTTANNKLNDSNKELNQTNEKLRSTLGIVNAQKEQIEDANKQITNQNKELNQYRSHLEQLVEERTGELLSAKNKAEESDRLKTAFLQNMSHEIRTPMNGILGFLELLREPDLDEINKNNYIDIINNSGQRLLTTINDIIELSRIESDQLFVHYSVFDIMEVMNDHFKFFSRQAEEKGITLKLSAQILDKQAIVESDRQILDNILTNLINNSIKFTQNGTVEFGNYLENDSMIFFVKDTGIGIPADRLEAIFDRFVQADMKNTRTHEGSGLGLSIVKGYLEILNGSVWVESEIGKGSTFYFSIPYKPADAKELIKVEKKEPTDISKKKLTILIVEDDENSLLYIKSILKNLTANLLNASNGNDAVKLIKENLNISLVLMDIKMPELNGFDATRKIREFNNTVPIIAQTAYAFSENKEEAFKAGCNDYITKPINGKELIKLIQKYTQ